jgi:hypothetical protein
MLRQSQTDLKTHTPKSSMSISLQTLNKKYSLDVIKEEAKVLLEKRVIERHLRISVLFKYIPQRNWHGFQRELELNDFSLCDQIGDFISQESWSDD